MGGGVSQAAVGGWFPCGPEEAGLVFLKRFIRRAWRQGRTRKDLSIGEMFMMWTSGLWKWRLLPGGLLMAPQVLWDPLTEQEKNNLAAWLDGINHYALPPCNWMFFAILVNVALKERGMHYHPDKLQEYLDYIESCYQGDGWYLDGQNGEKDYYVSFAFHYYSLIYVRFMEKEDPDRCLEYKNRAGQFCRGIYLLVLQIREKRWLMDDH